MIYTFEDLEEHILALQNTFALIGDMNGYSEQNLISIRNAAVESKGKYSADWKDDPEEKLAFDFYFCLEMASVLADEGDLSEKRRLRLYRMATMNKDVKEIWKMDPYWDPKAFLNDEQMKEKVWLPKWKKRKK